MLTSEIEVVIYENDNETTGVFQYEKTLIMVSGNLKVICNYLNDYHNKGKLIIIASHGDPSE